LAKNSLYWICAGKIIRRLNLVFATEKLDKKELGSIMKMVIISKKEKT